MHHYKLHIQLFILFEIVLTLYFLVKDIFFSDLPLDIFGALLMSSGYIVF